MIEQLMVQLGCYDLIPHSCKLILFNVGLKACALSPIRQSEFRCCWI